jgi:hypothetical protein
MQPSTSLHDQSSPRQAARHSVELPCEVITPDHDAPALMWASDMSAGGLWLQTSEPLPLGSELVVCLRPAVWWRARELMVFAEVARLSRGRRELDDGPGMGIEFTDLTQPERWMLRRWLRPRPFIAARRRVQARRVPTPLPPFADHPFASRLS